MIAGIRIKYLRAAVEKEGDARGVDINVEVKGVRAEKGDVYIDYRYTATYSEGIAKVEMTGTLLAQEGGRAAGIMKSWEERRALPEDFFEEVLNGITYTCGTEAVLAVYPLGINPPMVPVRYGIVPEQEL